MKNYLKLVRWPNLIMLALLQYLLRYAMAGPILEMENLGLLLTDFEFFIMSISCIFIAAGGYAINDIEDFEIDRINKPDKQIVGKFIQKESAYNFYLIITFLGILGGFYLTYIKDYKYIGVINLICAGLLYFYSTGYKCIPLVGNLIISLLSAFIIFMVVLPEPLAREHQGVMLLIGAFMFFSFFMTLLREIIKDIEDVEGDRQMNCQTIANTLGVNRSKWIAIIITFLLIVCLTGAQYLSKQWESILPFLFVSIFIDLPMILLFFKLINAHNKLDFTKASFWLKLTMFTGTISIAIFYYSFK